MKRLNRKRHDQRHSKVYLSSGRCHARRLAFERCEDRRMLSGISFTTNVSLVPIQSEGGFLTVNTNGFFSTTANNFLSDADSFNQPLDVFALTYQWQLINTGQLLGAAADTTGNEAASSFATPTLRPTLLDFDLSDTLVLEPPISSTGNSVTQDKEIIDVDDLHDNFSNDAPGLPGKTLKPLVIEDPIQIGTIPPNSDEFEQREGGALEVAAMVNTTQRAYETQLSAAIVHNLNRDGMLPTTAPTPTRPVVAELARAIAFETLGQQQGNQTGEMNRATSGQLREPTQATPQKIEPVSVQLRVTPAGRTSTEKAESNESSTQVYAASHVGEDSAAYLAERIENEQQAAQIATFAQWPTLATVIAGYLLIERRSPKSAQTVQTPPRRQRRRQHQTPVR